MLKEEYYDVVVLGAGSSGVAAAASAARNGARTLLVDAGPAAGGELLSGINLLGCLSSRGEWIVGGIVKDLLAECERLDGYIGPLTDYRPLYYVAYDPEVMRVAVSRLLKESGVELRLYTFAETAVRHGDDVTGMILLNKTGRTLVRAKIFIDCSGDGDLAVSAGAAFESGDPVTGEFQAVTLVFRMVGVEPQPLLEFVRARPENFSIAEFSELGLTQRESAEALYEQGIPKVCLVPSGPLLGDAIRSKEMYPTSIVAIAPLSLGRKEVSINATKMSCIDATKVDQLSGAYAELIEQVQTCVAFLKRRVPGFENAYFSGLAPRIGIRETRRILGEYVLTGEDVQTGRKSADAVAKGGHPIDVWSPGTNHQWKTIAGGGSYDIPYATLIPRDIRNMFVAGRCLSSTREGQSSARVMGTCIALGQAAGTAAAMSLQSNSWSGDVRDVSVPRLRNLLVEQGAVLE